LGGYAVDNATLNRFFALHYLLPFVIAGLVGLHVWALHHVGQNNPIGISEKSKTDTLSFHPFYTVKDAFAVAVFLLIFAFFLFYQPDALGHADNYIEADAMKTPAHIVPEWYFLPFYAITPDDVAIKLGSKMVDGEKVPSGLTFYRLSQISTIYYFAYFLIILPVLGLVEKPKARPDSITKSVLDNSSHGNVVAAE